MRRRDLPHDAGLTLIELLVTMLLLGLVFSAVAGVMISMFAAQNTVSAVTQKTTAAQAAASNIAVGVRNASDLSLTTPSGSNQLLVVRTANSDATITWSCKAWYFDAGTATLRTKTTADGTKITAPTAAQLSGWALLAGDVAPRTGTGIFAAVAGGVAISFNAQTSAGPPVAIKTTATKRSGVTEAGSCF